MWEGLLSVFQSLESENTESTTAQRLCRSVAAEEFDELAIPSAYLAI